MTALVQTTYHYQFHGVGLRTSRPIDVLLPAPATQTPALDLWFGPLEQLAPAYRRAVCAHSGAEELPPSFPFRREPADGEELLAWMRGERLSLLVNFSTAGDVMRVGWLCSPPASEAELEQVVGSYSLPGLIGMALRLAGRLVLHGNVVDIGGAAVAWLGPKGAGKSTLAAAFVAAGFPLLADDQFVVWPEGNGFGVAQGLTRLHLTGESFAAMAQLDGGHHFEQPFGAEVKGYVTVGPPHDPPAAPRLAPLRAIYVLQPRRPELAAPVFAPATPAEGLHLLLTHCLARKTLPLRAEQQRHEFLSMGALARRVPVRLLQLPDDLARLPAVVQRLAAEHGDG